MTASRAQQALTAERRAALIRLRLAGVRFSDPRILDLGYESRGHASKDFVRALEQHREEEAAEVATYRQQENERLDALLEAAWPQATKPSPIFNKDREIVGEEVDMRAVDTVLRLMDRRAKLNGLDMPVKAELSGPGGGGVPIGPVGLAELRTLIQAAGDPDEDDTDDDPREHPDPDDADDNRA
ncbi:hypothetical protein ABZ383_31045 [Streptomyces sp. NPDC005900]|uniref:hypothetical protein n=1 Tax=Streptomyces sp. NPDC005900 TaxID=3154569 RepID=UPI0033F6DF96